MAGRWAGRSLGAGRPEPAAKTPVARTRRWWDRLPGPNGRVATGYSRHIARAGGQSQVPGRRAGPHRPGTNRGPGALTTSRQPRRDATAVAPHGVLATNETPSTEVAETTPDPTHLKPSATAGRPRRTRSPAPTATSRAPHQRQGCAETARLRSHETRCASSHGDPPHRRLPAPTPPGPKTPLDAGSAGCCTLRSALRAGGKTTGGTGHTKAAGVAGAPEAPAADGSMRPSAVAVRVPTQWMPQTAYVSPSPRRMWLGCG